MFGRMIWKTPTPLPKPPNGQRLYRWRKYTIERSFAEAEELHGLRYARMLDIANMYEQRFLTAAVQNMKRIPNAFRFFSLPFLLRFYSKGMISREIMPFVNGLNSGFAGGSFFLRLRQA